jgi:hypothetical protein
MRATEVNKIAAEIEHHKGDYERAHGMEDDLYINVLKAIAEQRGDEPWRLAQEALKTQDIQFGRYCA